MKENYYHPAMELVIVSIEDGACTSASGTEQFTQQQGTWETINSNF